MTLEELQARAEIRELVDRFANFEIDVPAQMALFTKDTHVRVYMGTTLAFDLHGIEELEKAFSGAVQGVKRSQHMNGQQVVELNGDTATGTLYCRVVLITEEDGREIFNDHCVIYEDVYAKEGGRWLIKARTSHFVISDKHALGA